jgi:tetratricopeptide (TPR) repeat protein
LQQAGEVAVAESRLEEGRECYLKALHLQLDVLAREDVFEWPEFVPGIEALVLALQDAPLPERTNARLMQHYERAGDYAKAEDAFHALLAADPENQAIVEFGLAFYDRLATQSDETLAAANLPRSEVAEGMAELQGRRGSKAA